MESFEPKKLLILRILEILTEYSDSEHKLRQGDIMNLLRLNYGIECERKAVARNVEYLQDAGYDIVSDKSGTYLAERKFEIGELRLLIDSVLANRNVCKPHTKELVAKLAKEGGKYFKNYTKHVINLDDYVTFLSAGNIVQKDYEAILTTPTTATLSGHTLTVKAEGNINVRTGPSTNYKVIGVVKSGAKVEVLEITSNNWYKIAWNNGVGYVSNVSNKYFAYTEIKSKASASTTSATSNKYKVSITASALYVRTGPDTRYKAKTTVHKGENYYIIEEAVDSRGVKWGLLENYKTSRNGWISLSYAKKV